MNRLQKYPTPLGWILCKVYLYPWIRLCYLYNYTNFACRPQYIGSFMGSTTRTVCFSGVVCWGVSPLGMVKARLPKRTGSTAFSSSGAEGRPNAAPDSVSSYPPTCGCWAPASKYSVLAGNSRSCSKVVRLSGDSCTAARRSRYVVSLIYFPNLCYNQLLLREKGI